MITKAKTKRSSRARAKQSKNGRTRTNAKPNGLSATRKYASRIRLPIDPRNDVFAPAMECLPAEHYRHVDIVGSPDAGRARLWGGLDDKHALWAIQVAAGDGTVETLRIVPGDQVDIELAACNDLGLGCGRHAYKRRVLWAFHDEVLLPTDEYERRIDEQLKRDLADIPGK